MESIETLNYRLIKYYGCFDGGDKPNYRVVFSEDQFEYRRGIYDKFDAHGNWIGRVDEIRYVPKYRQWIPKKWVLERCLGVPEGQKTELTTKWSYEPLFVFQDKDKNPLPPRWDVIYIVIETLHQEAAKAVGVKYRDPYSDPKVAPELMKKELDDMYQELWGNETDVADALHLGYGVTVDKEKDNAGTSMVESTEKGSSVSTEPA